MTTRLRLGLLGGTFDPIHVGHLDAADAAQHALQLDEVRFIPSHDPPHRPSDPSANAFHRFALVALALAGHAKYRASDLELRRDGPSYSADTLRAMRSEGWSASQLFFILGADAFAEIATWREFPAVLDAAHFVVISRPGTTLDAATARTPELRSRVRSVDAAATNGPETFVFLVEARCVVDHDTRAARRRSVDRRSGARRRCPAHRHEQVVWSGRQLAWQRPARPDLTRRNERLAHRMRNCRRR
jgi:nicotinate-nucleotide adenylyltransferase